MARTRTARTPLQHFVELVWRSPLYALPFAFFFGVLSGAQPRHYVTFYVVSLVFSYAISIAMWLVGCLRPDAREGAMLDPQGAGRTLAATIAAYAGASLAAAMVAALIVHLFIVPGFLGGPRRVLTVILFTLLFSALGIGISYAVHFYGHAIARARSEEELHLARRIQRSFLISNFPQRPALEIHALNVSSKHVSGDFYDVVPAGEGAYLLCIADVSGKGVPAALLGSMLQASLRTQAPTVTSPAAILQTVNRLLCESAPNGQFATVFLARVDEASLALSYANAGHNPPVVFRAGGERIALDRGGIPVGVLDSAAYDEGELRLTAGDRILFYTDGASEAANGRQELLGDDRLVEMAGALPVALPARATLDQVLAGIRSHLAGLEPQDDITLMALRVLAPGERAAAAQEVAL